MKISRIIPIALLSSFFVTISVSAGEWKQDANGWWYDNGNGTYPTSTWQWIDGNGDGVSECYYFSSNGYVLTNTTIDGSEVNADGAWTVNGAVQTENAAAATVQNTHANSGAYCWAEFSRFNSHAYENGLKDTLVYSEGTLSNITFIKANSFLKSYTADFTDVDGNQWVLVLVLTDKQLNELKEKVDGKTSFIYGKYSGYSDVLKKPAIQVTDCIANEERITLATALAN